MLRVRLRADGRAAHSAFPELGESAIDKLLDALMVLRGVALPDDPVLGRTHYTVGLIEGGVAPNVVSPHASAEAARSEPWATATPCATAIARWSTSLVAIEQVLDVPPVRLHTVPGFETAVFRLHHRRPAADRWGTPLLLGPGSIHVAHTDDEHVAIDELHRAAIDLYESLVRAADIGSAVAGLGSIEVHALPRLQPDARQYATLNVCRRTPMCPAVGEPHRGPDPVQLQPANRVRAGRQQR